MLSSILLFLSGQDTVVILLVALVLFGGKKLPELARGLGQGIREFKDASEGVKRDIQDQINKETAKNNEAAVQNTTTELPAALVPDHSTPIVDTPATPVTETTLVADHSAPATHTAEAPVEPKVEHPRETPLP